MNLKAVAGAIRSPKTPIKLKEGLLRKYGSQLKREFGKSLPEILENPLAKWETPKMHKKVKKCVQKVKSKGVKSPWAVCKSSVGHLKDNPGAKWHEEQAKEHGLRALKAHEQGEELYEMLETGAHNAHIDSAKKSKKLGINPPKGAVKIYDNIEAIEAQKGKDSCWPKEHFRHDFKHKSEAAIYGMPDGSLVIKGKKPLWKNFSYPTKSRNK